MSIQARVHADITSLQSDITRLMQQAVVASSEALATEGDNVVISGERNLLDNADLSSNLDNLRALFAMFEQKTSLVKLLDASCRAQGVQIYIGGESQLMPMDDMTVITAPLQRRRRGGRHARRDRADAHGLRARHSVGRYHGPALVERLVAALVDVGARGVRPIGRSLPRGALTSRIL